MDPNEIPEIYRATYDNADAAFALGMHDFPGFRKNLERLERVEAARATVEGDGGGVLMNMPRIDENPVRPQFRVAHIYDYALIHALSKSMSRESAVRAVGALWRGMRQRGADRLNALDDETRHAIIADLRESWQRYADESSVKAPADNGFFVDYPWLAFDPEMLERTERRLECPLLWVLPADSWAARHTFLLTFDDPEDRPRISDWCTSLSKRLRMVFAASAPDEQADIAPVRSVVVVNVTALLADVDRRLEMRVRARRLKGY